MSSDPSQFTGTREPASGQRPHDPDPAASADTHNASTVLPATVTYRASEGDTDLQGARLGDYELLEKLGAGGMGVVYRARQRSANRIVALKVIRPERLAELAPEIRAETLQRFLTEAQAAARLEHDHIVTVYDVGEADGQPFYSMRYVEGRSLAELLRDGPLENRRAAAFLEPVARAVHYAHERGILHRDLKPRNILLDSTDRPYVADFGLAKLLDDGSSGMTQTGHAIGTPSYMSPEQAQDASRVTAASDLYSLGATLFDLLTGRPPFRAATNVETLRQAIEQEPVAPRQLNPGIDRDLETITLKCLQKEPTRRYSSAAALAEDLQRYLNREPIRARRVSAPERLVRWCRREPVIALLLLFVSASLLCGTAVSSYFAVQESRERVRADSNATKASRSALLAKEHEQDALNRFYLAQMQLAHAAWVSGEFGRFSELLDEQVPADGDADRRNWEWYYLDALRRRIESISHAHDGVVTSVCWSPEGGLLASAGEDGIVKVWDVTSHTERLRISGEGGTVYSVQWSSDGQKLVSSGYRGIWVWDATTGRRIHKMGTDDRIYDCAVLSRDGTLLASTSKSDRGNTVEIWNTDTAELLRSFATDFVGHPSLAFSPDGRELAGPVEGGLLAIWNTETGKPVYRRPRRGGVFISGWSEFPIAWSPCGRWLASADQDGDISITDTATKSVVRTLRGHYGMVSGLRWDDSGEQLLSGGYDRIVRVWDASSGKIIRAFRGNSTPVTTVAWDGASRRIASADRDGSIKIWNVDSEQDLFAIRTTTSVFGIAWSPDGQKFAITSTASDAPISVWDVSTRTRVRNLGLAKANRTNVFFQLAWRPDSTWLAACSGDAPSFWDADTGRQIEDVSIAGSASVAAWSPDGKQLAFAGQIPGPISVWHVEQQRKLANASVHEHGVSSISWHPGGEFVASGDHGGLVKVWDYRDGELLFSEKGDDAAILSMAWHPDGKRLVTGSASGFVRIWEPFDGLLRKSQRSHTAAVSSLAWSPDGSRLATASGRSAVFFSPGKGQRIAAPDADHSVKVWDADVSQEILALPSGIRGIYVAAWSPDGKRIAVAGEEPAVRIWEAPEMPTVSRRAVPDFAEH